MRKALKENSDPEMALLMLRATPIDHKLASTAEPLFQCKLNTNLPVYIKNTHRDRDSVVDRLQERQLNQKLNHDRSAQDLPTLYPGQHITMQDHVSDRWTCAKIQGQCPEPHTHGKGMSKEARWRLAV